MKKKFIELLFNAGAGWTAYFIAMTILLIFPIIAVYLNYTIPLYIQWARGFFILAMIIYAQYMINFYSRRFSRKLSRDAIENSRDLAEVTNNNLERNYQKLVEIHEIALIILNNTTKTPRPKK